MASRTRSVLKRVLPPSTKAVVRRIRKFITAPPIDDVVLANYLVERDDNSTPRVTIVLPRLEKGSDFGGFATGIDIFTELCIELQTTRPLDVRVIITDIVFDTDPSIVISRAARAGLVIAQQQITLVRDTNATIAVRANEIFITYNWWTTLNFARVRDAQATIFGAAPKPLAWLMQDYEPSFAPFSSAHMLARAAYDTSAPLWGIINSSNLANFIERMSHRCERAFVFEPVISDGLRPFLDAVPASAREKRIVVYGRPAVARNCFPAIVRGLRRWAADHPEFADWDIVSAGTEHEPVALGDGREMTSVGKLSLEDYAQLMLTSSVGLSLMASPHPSYPPLEMAHMGLRTITNTYACKDLSMFHPNIVSIASMAEAPLAAALASACADAGAPVSSARNEIYVRADKYPFLDDLAQSLRAALAD